MAFPLIPLIGIGAVGVAGAVAGSVFGGGDTKKEQNQDATIPQVTNTYQTTNNVSTVTFKPNANSTATVIQRNEPIANVTPKATLTQDATATDETGISTQTIFIIGGVALGAVALRQLLK